MKETENSLNRTSRKWLLGVGTVTVFTGILAIILPNMATLAIETILAVIFVVASVVYVIHSFEADNMKELIICALLAMIYGIAGTLLLIHPFKGAFTLTVLLTLLLIVSGVFKILRSFYFRPMVFWSWLFVNGIISLALGILIWGALPEVANWVIGLLVGIELFFSGVVMIMFGFNPEEKTLEI